MNIDKFINDVEKVYKNYGLYISSDMYGDKVIKDFKGNIMAKLPYFSEKDGGFKN